MEEYRTVKNFEKYEVSKNGAVRNKKTQRELKPMLTKTGYLTVHLMDDQAKKNVNLIHRLVCNTFRENPDNKRCVDHINNNKLDNRLENLRFATHSENLYNSKLSVKNKTGSKGVAYDTERNMYICYIYKNKKRTFLGRFETLEEATNARREASHRLFGEFVNESEK